MTFQKKYFFFVIMYCSFCCLILSWAELQWNSFSSISDVGIKLILVFYMLEHRHKKWKDSLDTRAVLLIISLDLEISGVVVRGIHQSNEKWLLPVRIFLVKMTLRLSVVTAMVPTLLKQMRRLLQIKKIIPNLPSINKNGWLLVHPPTLLKKLRPLHRKRAITGPWRVLSTVEVR